MWTLLDLCTDKLRTLVSFFCGLASAGTAYLIQIQRKVNKASFSIFRFLSIPNADDTKEDSDHLFPAVTEETVASSEKLAPQAPFVRQCAVSEFNFDYSAATPINWSDNSSKHNNSSHHNNKSTSNTNQTDHDHGRNHNHNHERNHPHLDPDALLSQFNSSFNYQLAHTNTIEGPEYGHLVHSNYTLPPLEEDHSRVLTLPLSPPLLTSRLIFVNDANDDFDATTDNDVPPLDDELFISFFADRPTKRERRESITNLDTDDTSDNQHDISGVEDHDSFINNTDTNIPYKVRKTSPSPVDAPYACEFCNVRFKVKGYLTRHVKKHYTSKPFRCPYWDSTKTLSTKNENHPHNNNNNNNSNNNSNSNSDDGDTDGVDIDVDNVASTTDDDAVAANNSVVDEPVSRCHITGGFSRRDTLNTHLKALHFIYPSGTKSVDRDRKSGRCAACFKEFTNNKEWLTRHIMTNDCSSIITKYK